MKKYYNTEIFFRESKYEIIMLTVKKYNNKVTFYNKKTYEKISERRVNAFVISYYKKSKLYKEMPLIAGNSTKNI